MFLPIEGVLLQVGQMVRHRHSGAGKLEKDGETKRHGYFCVFEG